MSDKVSNDGLEPEQTFEINIKTLETQLHKVRVTKDMTVMALKLKIVDLTGVPAEQQRLIFRGRVLKDNDPLSEYHVEDGHTLHLVARRPVTEGPCTTGTSSSDTNRNTGNESSGNEQRTRPGQVPRNLLLGAVNIADGGEDLTNEIIRGVGELLRNIGSGIPAPGAGPTNNTSSTSAGSGTGQNGSQNNSNRGQPVNQVQPGFAVLNHQIQFSQMPPPPPLIPRNMVIPDSLTTLQDFIHRMEGVLHDSSSQNNVQNAPRPPAVPVDQRGVPTTEALISVLEQARQLITGSFASSISHLMERLQREAGYTDASVRQSIQSEAMRAGILMQHMGALLLELGRTTMTLRMGQTPEESFVNAGPAAYIHSNGPNPIMVQPVPLQTAPLIGVSSGPVMSGVAGPFPGEDPTQNINIEIPAGGVPASGDLNAVQQTQPTGDPQPIRSLAPGVVAAVPARGAAGSTGHVVSVIYPVQVRTQVTAGSMGPPPPSAAPQAQPTTTTTTQNSQNVPAGNGIGSLLGQISTQLNSMLSGRNLGQVNAGPNANANSAGTGTTVQAPEPGNLSGRSLNRQDASVIRSAGVQTNTSEENQEKKPEQGSSDAVASSASETIQSPKHSLGSEPPAAPLGLGLGGLRPTKKTKQSNSTPSASRPSTEGGSSQPPNPNPIDQIIRSVLSQGGSGFGPNQTHQASQGPPQRADISSMLSQVFQSPALDNLLTNMAGQTGMGSPNELRGMLEQCTRDPAVKGMFSDLVGQVDRQRTGMATGPSNGGVDLSGLVQKMMPIVANVISGGTGTGTRSQSHEDSVLVPVPEPVQPEPGTTARIGEIPLQRAAVRIEGNDSASNIFTSVVESAGFYDGGDTDIMDLVEELSSNDNLANDYMNVLSEEIRRRLQSDSNNGSKS